MTLLLQILIGSALLIAAEVLEDKLGDFISFTYLAGILSVIIWDRLKN